ncbi:serine/threonine protein kinase [Ktedonospora formicarum]|uniref:non-specific serine/threonine protein kinase n=1 Tax=Ktedonospora formicarum TaxID=2778364 RepID=A0A8J3MWZ9_9CHLR|nr:serine/threonine-protein kinase [Ktedonospora formicarum]GHO48080.1 hypothetical protein KSX_62430 [Ktedonospora formicarum]
MANLIGKQLGNYTLTQLLGQGGFAEVYLGEHVYLKTPAAIKVLHAQLSGQDDTESFQREAQYIARLVHPNIIRVLDFGIAEQVPFLVMDYAPRGTLRQKHPRGTRLPLNTILPYVKQTAAALQHAHDERLIHRDIKPENMLLGRQGDVLLSDFGIALVAQSSRYQNTQDVIGTVAYMSPEQIQGKPRSASDQYSLAIVVYEWLTGVRPFNGSFTELCTQHMFATVPPMREQVSDISPQVEQVVNIALAKDYHQRFGSIKAFANALEQASQGQSPTPPTYNVSSPHHPTVLVQPNRPPAPAQSNEPVSLQQAATVPQEHATPPQPVPSHAQLQRNVTPPAAFTPPDNARQRGEPSSTPQGLATPERRPSAWTLSRIQLTAMLIGVLLSFIVAYIGVRSPDEQQEALLFAGSFALAYFFATKYGPWVGMLTALTTMLTNAIYYNDNSQVAISFIMRFTAMAFVASLAFLKTHGNYRRFLDIVLAVSTSFAGWVVYVAGAYFTRLFYSSGLRSELLYADNTLSQLSTIIEHIVEEVTDNWTYDSSGLIALVVLIAALLAANLFNGKTNKAS